MKKVFIICMAIFFWAAVASADPVEEGLPETATPQVKNSTRQMLNQGFNTENMIDMTRQMLTNNFSQQHVLQAHTILMDARKQGLQTEPIMNKAHEGLAKQVQPKAVVQAMEQVRSRHAFASKQARAFTNDKAKINQMATVLRSHYAGLTGKNPEYEQNPCGRFGHANFYDHPDDGTLRNAFAGDRRFGMPGTRTGAQRPRNA
jgi:hypothetical protein